MLIYIRQIGTKFCVTDLETERFYMTDDIELLWEKFNYKADMGAVELTVDDKLKTSPLFVENL